MFSKTDSNLQLRQAAAAGNLKLVRSLLQNPDPVTRPKVNGQGEDSGKTALHRVLDGMHLIHGRNPGYSFFERSVTDSPREKAIVNFIAGDVKSPLLDDVPQDEIKLKTLHGIAVLLLITGANILLEDKQGRTCASLIRNLPEESQGSFIIFLGAEPLSQLPQEGERATLYFR